MTNLTRNGYSLIIPYFNEGKTISITLQEYIYELEKLSINYEIIIVDDGSYLQAKDFIKKTIDNLLIIEHSINKGYGSAINTGIKNSKFENIIITDSDNTYPAEKIVEMIKSYERFPCMVVASREGKNANIPLLRRPAKYLLRMLACYLCSYRIRDLNSGFRIFKKEFYQKYVNLMPNRFSMTSTLTILAVMHNYDIYYIKSDYRKRKGNSKINPIKDTAKFLSLVLKLVILTDGMRVFFPLSLLMIFSSIFILMLRLIGFTIGGATSVILFCSGIQILCFGALCKCINYRNGKGR